MTDTASPEINVEDLMRRIRVDVARRRMHAAYSQSSRATVAPSAAEVTPTLPEYTHVPVSLPRAREGDGCVAMKSEYALADFLAYHDEDFVRSAYHGILRREPDPEGFVHYLDLLRSERLSKAEIIGQMHFSPEGKSHAVTVRGLLLPFALHSAYRLPVLGYGLALANFMVRLPSVVRNWKRFEAYMLRERREQGLHVNALASEVEAIINQLQQKGAERDVHLVQLMADLTSGSAVEINARLDDLAQRKADAGELAATTTLLGEKIAGLTQALETKADTERVAHLSGQLVDLEQRKADAGDLAATATRLGEDLAQKADAATTQRETQEIQRQILDQKRNVLDQQLRLARLLEDARKRLPEPISTGQLETMVAEEDRLLDAFYVSFEDRFRGTREDIKQRVAIYLPIVREANAGTRNAPILDIGCGRGEWLQLLQENDLFARGADTNRVMVSQCRELGLEVAEADGIEYLRSLIANSLGAVTGIHIIEHIPFKRLISLFDEALRVLKPGGVAIFETPNPENLIVGACNFYYDPSHLNPLPPEPMRFIMEARGFGGVEVLRLHPQPESAMLREGTEQLQQIVNNLMFSAQDYALVARKN